MIYEVLARFDHCILTSFADGKMPNAALIRSFLLTHERKMACIERLCDQVRRAETSANIGGKFEISRFHVLIDSGAKMFANAALGAQEAMLMSKAERDRRDKQANYIAETEAEFAEQDKEARSTKLVSRPGDIAR